MKKLLLFSLLAMIFTIGFSDDAYGQRRGKKKKSSKTDEYFDESGNFTSKLWYGGGFNLGFSGSSRYNQFTIGVSPMVGYKLFDGNLSIGPRISLDYLLVKGEAITLTGQLPPRNTYRINSFSYSIAGFARYKIFPAIFAHVEVEGQSIEQIPTLNGFLVYDSAQDDVLTVREFRENVYIGAGYSSGGSLIGYEILLLYNIVDQGDSIALPISFRFGITYNF